MTVIGHLWCAGQACASHRSSLLEALLSCFTGEEMEALKLVVHGHIAKMEQILNGACLI